jgi:putative FmdB family regulatory protein
MPTYEYICKDCGHEMEAFQRMSEAALTDCPACMAPALKRKIGRGAGFIFKGGGFYETDFKDRKGTKPGDEKPAESSPAKEKPAESTTAAAKPETKPATTTGTSAS